MSCLTGGRKSPRREQFTINLRDVWAAGTCEYKSLVIHNPPAERERRRSPLELGLNLVGLDF